MPFPPRKLVLQQPEVVDLGCGCRQSIFSTLFSASSSSSSSLKQRIHKSPSSTTSSSSVTISNFPSTNSPVKKKKKKKKNGGVAEESVAIVKESFDPYADFYESMLVMIMEKEIYDWEDLCHLLNRYLSVNSSCHRRIILRAFAEIWNDVFLPSAEGDGE